MLAHVADRWWWFSIMCTELWGAAAPDVLFDLVGQHLNHKDNRTCRRWAHHERSPDQSILWMLIRSKEGNRVVDYINESGPPAEWWSAQIIVTRKAAFADNFSKCVQALNK